MARKKNSDRSNEAGTTSTKLLMFNFVMAPKPEPGAAGIDKLPGIGRSITSAGHEIQAIEQTFGAANCELSFEKRTICMAVHLTIKPDLVGPPSIHDNLERTARELRANVSGGTPKPYCVALTDVTYLPLLRAISRNHCDRTPAPTLAEEGCTHPIPVLNSQAFDQPLAPDPTERQGVFELVGLRWGTKKELILLLTKDALAVEVSNELESRALVWTLRDIRRGIWIEGTIVLRDDRTWELKHSAKVVERQSLLEPEPPEAKPVEPVTEA